MLKYSTTDPLSAQQSEYVEDIISGSEHLLELISSILDLSMIEADRITFSLETVDPNQIVAECVALTSSIGTRRNITIVNEFSVETFATVRHQILWDS